MRAFNPAGVADRWGTYSHGVELEGPVRLLFGAGQRRASMRTAASASASRSSRASSGGTSGRSWPEPGMGVSDIV